MITCLNKDNNLLNKKSEMINESKTSREALQKDLQKLLLQLEKQPPCSYYYSFLIKTSLH